MISISDIPVLRRFSALQIEVLAYLLTGAWNTVFGMGLYALAYHLWGEYIHYIVLSIFVNILAITNAFLCYKLFVFRTKGNWLQEYFRCYVVYGSVSLCNIGLLWLLVHFFNMNPAWANAFGIAFVAFVSYFAHKFFSFKKNQNTEQSEA